MDLLRRRNQRRPLAGKRLSAVKRPLNAGKPLASDALPLPVWLTNKVFVVLFFAASYYLMRRWREKIRNSTPLHLLTPSELIAIVSLIASIIYLLGFFGVDYAQHFISEPEPQNHPKKPENRLKKPENRTNKPEEGTPKCDSAPKFDLGAGDDELVDLVASGSVPSYSLEARLGDCKRAALVRRRALEKSTAKILDGLPLHGFNYETIFGQCCEMPVGYVQLPVGVCGPLVLDGAEYTVPMATTEGCLVASTNRGCKAIAMSGGASSVVLRDCMTRAPVVRFRSAKRAAELKFFLEEPINFDTLAVVFNKSSRFARLQGIQCALAGKNLYMRFSCSTGDAMGMNMVSKGVQNVLDFLQSDFPDMDVISISGNFCSDKKPAAVNWIEGRGKSVVCEAVIKEEVVAKVLKTSVSALVELNMLKNLAGSAVAGALGGFNAHASNIVTAIYIATGQDPAQNVESSHCITMMEPLNDGRDLHVSVTMPSIEVIINTVN
ncbi:3-hydroxy-3-methylglutaryl-coenzyme A reductase 1 [Amborella trichopoda]|uniref:hydroxymethylglutaryl-CoA reductase (NADPH) n=1 Tax=Amborella trichopoda TaxID=13333 RepID=W1PUZ1_AMBTC|nr:3-hydroxy-3-methylglutaryl-coenzyme A reductase 1 [Amborella trichopoda]ERN11526.1 hypothetical protein AMTR_s00022p00133290 [Amborella trichopoda]|eukprot:XP_006849945.1 3-hydroxy-3-methylglutaryl-coenzyme A reductase 1 [Amborella trichopoda]